MKGHAGKILRVDLTTREVHVIPTRRYEQWLGGHGMGSAIFFDLVKDKTIDGFDAGNVVTLMTSPFCGTLVPSAGGRTEVQGIGVQSYPIGWFTRSGFGGRFSTQLKYAGWDGVAIQGRADRPVWIDIRNGNVHIRDCAPLSLWGTDTRECQERIWRYVANGGSPDGWSRPGGGRTTQRPAVLAIGPAGENLSRIACLIHDAGNGAGQGGFGAVWGAKQLKAVSVTGTGSVAVHDPKALLRTRVWQLENYGYNPKQPYGGGKVFHGGPQPVTAYARGRPQVRHRPQACVACIAGCRGRYEDGIGNEVICANSAFYEDADTLGIQREACDLLNRYGINSFELLWGLKYLLALHQAGDLDAPGGIDCPLGFDDYGSLDFARRLANTIAYRSDGRGNPHPFGDALAEGAFRASKQWRKQEHLIGRWYPHWGLPLHEGPRTHLDWGYGTVLGDRDINEHEFYQMASLVRGDPEEIVRIYTDKMAPFEGDLRMLDFSTENMYSEHIAKLVSWHRYYTRFFKQSLLFCDCKWPDLLNPRAPGLVGSTGQAEPMFLKAVTGMDLSFRDGIEIGRRIWNLDHAIWTLQGRHRDMVHFSDAMHKEPSGGLVFGLRRGKWRRINFAARAIDRTLFEEFKTRFYRIQGWDTTTGYPVRETLAGLGLGYVADELEEKGRLGREPVSGVPYHSGAGILS